MVEEPTDTSSDFWLIPHPSVCLYKMLINEPNAQADIQIRKSYIKMHAITRGKENFVTRF